MASFGRSCADRAASPAPPLSAAEAEGAAREACLRLLTDRPRSRHELAQRLRDRGFDPDVAAGVLDRLEQVALVDDAAFARAWVHSRHTVGGRGRRALAMELRTKGVAEHHAAAALEQVDDASEAQRAGELVRRTLRGASAPDGPQRAALVRKLVGKLARRGYAPGLAFTVVRAELAALGADTEDLLADG